MDKEGTSGSGTGKMDHSGDFYSVVRTISLLVQWSEGPYIPLNCAIERAIAKQGINLIAKYKSQWLPESFDPETYLCFSFVFCCRIEISGLATTYPIARLRVGSGGGRWVPLVRGWEQPRNGPIRYNPMDIHPITHFHPQPVPHPRKFGNWINCAFDIWKRGREAATQCERDSVPVRASPPYSGDF